MTLFPQYNTVYGWQLPLAIRQHMFMPVGWEQKGCRMPHVRTIRDRCTCQLLSPSCPGGWQSYNMERAWALVTLERTL